ncbi:hypothetical protein L1I30_13610 [Gillisia sp. M10.2A]|uniref:Flavodoxin-like domain-containing protein n=1 Tax=Gillisia lutea TaxID=2909668 RepID=A0ABS9EIM9_9FLAO|nr:hypothetical protein [Gillisia lutea]MCF4102709.1 hypothetical protein [Gillisia lutea]
MLKHLNKILIIIILGVLGVVVWYYFSHTKTQSVPYYVNSPKLETKLLIATQGSELKTAVVNGVVDHYKDEDIYIKVIDVYSLFSVNLEKWDAVVILNSWQYWTPSKNVMEFLKESKGKQDKLVVLSTSGDPDVEGIDAISGESIKEKIPEYTEEIILRVDKILNRTK